MKHILPAILLSLPLSALAANLKIEDYKGQYARLNDNQKCMSKIVVDVYQNRLRVYDLSSGANVLNREIHNEKVRIGDTLIEGSIEDKILTEKRYKLNRAIGLNLSKKQISEVKVIRTQDSLQIEDGTNSCHFAVDLPEITPPVPGTDKPEVQVPAPAPESDEIIIDITKPAPDKYVDIRKEFKSADELLDVSRAEENFKKLLKLKSGTGRYLDDVIGLLDKKEKFSPAEIVLALRLPYFSAEHAAQIKKKIKEISAAEEVDRELLSILTQNSYVAEGYGRTFQENLAYNLGRKLEEITLEELSLIMKEMYKGSSDPLLRILTSKIKDLSLEDKKGLIASVEELEAFDLAASFAVQIIKEEIKNFSTDELLSNSLKLKNETLVKVVESLGKDVSDPSLDNFYKIAEVLKNSGSGLANIANAFLVKIPVTLPQEILGMANKLKNGYYDHEAYKDEFLLKASAQVTPLAVADADQMLKKMGYEVKRAQLFDKLISKLTEELTVDAFDSLVKNVKNGYYDHEQYRDQSLLKHYGKISQTESQDNLKLLELLGSHASRKSLALGMFGRDKTKTLADVVALALKVNNGYYDHEDYRDQVLTEGVKQLSALTVSEMRLLIDTLSANGKRLNQLKTNVNKLPGLTVDDAKLLVAKISNGYYDHENYKDQGILVVLPKTSITTQADITSLMSVASSVGTKRSILAVGLKLTLAINDLTTLVNNEGNSTLKLEMIKGLAPKIAPLKASEVVGLIATVKNGYYDYENLKFQALDFLLGHVKLTQVSELKLLMEQRSDAVSRLAIHKKLKAQLGAVVASDLLIIADLIANGYYDHEQYKDDSILAESRLISVITLEDLLKLTDKVASAAKDRVLIVQMAPKLPSFSDLDLSKLLNKIANGYYDHEQYRDDTAVSLSAIVKEVSLDGINTVIKTIGGHAKRKKVALTLLAKKASVSKEDIQSIALNINNGYYEHENYKTQFLAESVALIK